MQKFTAHIDGIKRRCMRKGRLLLLFDFDGTLSPIADHPRDAKLPAEWGERLNRVAKRKGLVAAIVTGRSHADLKGRVGVRGLITASNHGYEIWKGGRRIFRRGGEFRGDMRALGKLVAAELDCVPGIVIEIKDYSVAVHYRMVDKCVERGVVRAAMRIMEPFADGHGWELMRGKKLLEMRPASYWDKGKAVVWIWRHLAEGYLPCYFGDDTTDEDAFRAIGGRGIAVRVGYRRSSAASYYVADMAEIGAFVDWILESSPT